jgi:hypothetical protein
MGQKSKETGRLPEDSAIKRLEHVNPVLGGEMIEDPLSRSRTQPSTKS